MATIALVIALAGVGVAVLPWSDEALEETEKSLWWCISGIAEQARRLFWK